MNNQEAREILSLFRPGTADEADPFFREARQWAAADPDLARWFQTHCDSYRALRRKFETIPIPPGLKEQILSERKVHRPNFQNFWAPLVPVAAVVALAVGIYLGFRPAPRSTDDYASYRKRMTESALRSYSMDLLATDPVQIRHFLEMRKAPADYSLPAGLKSAAAAGCVVTHWQGHPVSLICFKSGRPLPPGDLSDLWLFVTDRRNVPEAPASDVPVLARVNKATTAAWSAGDKTYLLAAVSDETFLRKYLQN